MSPFVVDGPAYISFSGGRSSARMLWEVIQEGMRPDVHVLFANTGKEDPRALDFVNECGSRWGVRVRWIEYAHPDAGGFREVTYETARRKGEPFRECIQNRGFLPHPGNPYCSTETKFRPAKFFMQSLGYEEWDAYVGMRADERSRVAKHRGKKLEGGRIEMPLADAGIHGGDIEAFWAAQPFVLGHHQHEGNCDLCWKKSGPKVRGLIDQRPELADWWAEQEKETGTRWRDDRPTYEALGNASRRQVRLPMLDDGGEPCGLCA